LKLLASVGAVAARVQAPFIAAAAPSLLGAESFANLPTAKALDASADRSGWKLYRQTEAAQWTGLTLPRVVGRAPVEGETEPLWMSAAWAFAVEVADAEARYGWPALISARAGSRVTGLPLWRPAKDAARPTDAALSAAQGFDLAGRGFLPLLPLDDKGDAAFVDARSCHDSDRLPPLLCAGHATRILAVHSRDMLSASLDRAEMETWLNRWLGGYRSEAGADAKATAKQPFADARVELREVKGRPGAYEMVATLRPVHQLDPPLAAPLRLVVPVPRRGE
jgi:type VI secretion system protein ImpC